MKLLKQLFHTADISEQNFKHNIYDSEVSQYSPLPRFYYIQGKKYDIDSPESVSEIPVCSTSFEINDEFWGIDTILRVHVNTYHSRIPEPLKEACYPKISEFKWSGLETESLKEKKARQKQALELNEKTEQLKPITLNDMTQFNFNFKLQAPFYDNKMSISLADSKTQMVIEKELLNLNDYVRQACTLCNIYPELLLPIKELIYNPEILDAGTPAERTEYYTFFQCEPYTKTGKVSKYPLILHYATQNLSEFQPAKNYFGRIYYMRDGSVGKCTLVFWRDSICHTIELFREGITLKIKKIQKSQHGISEILYKSN